MVQRIFAAFMKKDLQNLQYAEGEMLLIDKPYGWTSFGVVTQIKKWTRAKIGHAGTLDPLASGLVICCTGKLTKKLGELLGMKKEYTGIIHLGASTPTYDLESMPENTKDYQHISDAQIEEVRKTFMGVITQFPPVHSAVKQEGKPVYELARKGKEVIMKSRQVTIEEFEITRIALPEIHFRIVCSSGTYIRSIAHDFGAQLQCGGYLQQLVRTAIGEYRLEQAYTIPEMGAHFGSIMNARLIEPKVQALRP
ncbi:MAG: tRNA pseudouridine(55) synthase TruB [Chitinophagaceae bacterium]|nr:tRNA pseudouridine(55) synthase TruB [Chitinophagaceae bacterium]